MQNGFAEWLAFLSDKPLPVLKLTQKCVQTLIHQSQLSITQYAGPVLFDAGFAAYIFQYVNTQRVTAGKNPLTTLDNALSHLGQGAFQALLDKAGVFESMGLPEKNQRGYMRVMGQACHGALQAKDWAKQRNVLQPEETQLATLLQSITELLLWCYGGTVMREIEYLFYAKKQDYEKAAKAVLGCGMRELGAALAKKWNLPEMAIEGLNSRQDNFTLATGASLAAELGRVVSQNWYGQRAEDVIKRIAKYKAKPEGEIKRRLHINAVDFSPCLIEKSYAAPARLIPMLAADDYIDSEFIFHKKEQAEKARGEKTELKEAPDRVVSKRKAPDKNIPERKAPENKPAVPKKISPIERNETIRSKAVLARISANKSAPPMPSSTTPSKKSATLEKTAFMQVDNEVNRVEISKDTAKKTGISPVGISSVSKREIGVQVSAPASVPATAKAVVNKTLSQEKQKTPVVSPQLAVAIKEFQLMVKQARPAHDLIEKAVNMSLLCGVQRCIFSVKLPNKNMLVARYSAQVREDIAIKNLKISIKNPHVFTLLMEKSRNIFLNDTNRAKYWNSIPAPVKLSIGVKQFFAVSVFVNNHAMGLMYADKMKGNLSQAEFSQFQGVCRLLSKGIVQSAHNKKTA